MSERIPEISTEECLALYRDFYENPVIQELGKERAWTISNPDKMPVSLFAIQFDEMRGASPANPRDVATLDELLIKYPDAINNALYLQDKGRYVIIDVEPTASEKTREIMLSLPWLYGEVSMSGKGLHLIIEYPTELLNRYPNAHKTVIKHPSKTYEIHFQHWVTFTRKTIPKPESWGTRSITETFDGLFAEQRPPIIPSASLKVFATTLHDDTKHELEQDYLAALPAWWRSRVRLLFGSHKPRHTEGDISRRDFRFAMHIGYKYITLAKQYNHPMPTEEELCFITYNTLCWALIHQSLWRAKNDEDRGGMTYLERTVYTAVSKVLDNTDESENQDPQEG